MRLSIYDTGLIESGTIFIDGTTYSYSYDVSTDNNNGGTLQGISLQTQATMIDCVPGCPFDDIQIFVNYYGHSDYGDRWITAAFDGGETILNNGNADFSSLGYGGIHGKKSIYEANTLCWKYHCYMKTLLIIRLLLTL